MRGNIQIARIFGIPITINYSWLVVFILLTLALAFFYFPATYPQLSRTTQIIMGVVTSILFFGSVVFHELLHSIVARHYGLPIESINLWIFGGVSQLTEEPHDPKVEFNMSIAGPLSSFFLAAVFALVTYLGVLGRAPAVIGIAFYLAFINAFLGLFNLLPGFPLDGGRVLRSAVWYFTGDYVRATRVATIGGRAIAYILILLGLVSVFFGVFTGLWLVFLGWFLLQAAGASYRQMIIKKSLEDLTVGEVMTSQPTTVKEGTPLNQLVSDYFKRYRWGAFPVVNEDNFPRGLVTIRNVRGISRDKWQGTTVEQVMTPLSEDISVNPGDSIERILPKLEDSYDAALLVTEEGHLAGLVTRDEIVRALRIRLERGR